MKLSDHLLSLIERQPGNVIFRREIAGLGSPAQITAALTTLIDKGAIVRISIGIYARTRKSSVTGATVPAGSLETLATETLMKMGVPFNLGRAAAAYNAGDTTQLPGAFVVDTGERRISRKITVGGRTLGYANNWQ
jgi:hypothetical protein